MKHLAANQPRCFYCRKTFERQKDGAIQCSCGVTSLAIAADRIRLHDLLERTRPRRLVTL